MLVFRFQRRFTHKFQIICLHIYTSTVQRFLCVLSLPGAFAYQLSPQYAESAPLATTCLCLSLSPVSTCDSAIFMAVFALAVQVLPFPGALA